MAMRADRALRCCARDARSLRLVQSSRTATPGLLHRRASIADLQADAHLLAHHQKTAKALFSTSIRYAATAANPAPSYTRRATSAAATPSTSASRAAPPPPFPSESASKSAPVDANPTAVQDLSSGLSDGPLILDEGERQIDWTRSFHGLSSEPFSKEAQEILQSPIPNDDIEVKPDGIIFLPEIKYRRILNKAFGPGGWGLAPRGETIVTPKSITREYALVVHGRLVSIARGEQDYFTPEGIPTATEGCKSSALRRCCKDLGIASELWDPRFNRKFVKEHAKQVWVEHIVTKKRRQIWLRKDDEVRSPFKETK